MAVASHVLLSRCAAIAGLVNGLAILALTVYFKPVFPMFVAPLVGWNISFYCFYQVEKVMRATVIEARLYHDNHEKVPVDATAVHHRPGRAGGGGTRQGQTGPAGRGPRGRTRSHFAHMWAPEMAGGK